MALAFSNDPIRVQGGLGALGGRRLKLSTIDFDSSYPTGEEAVTKANFDLPGAIEGIVLVAITDGADVAQNVIFDQENSKLIVIAAGDGLEADNATDLSGVSAKFLVIGY